MSEVFLTKAQGGKLIAASEGDYALLKGYKVGDVIKAKISKPRNGGHHRKAWALINLIFENQGQYKGVADLMVEIKLKTGHYTEHLTTKGALIYVPKSISFASMEQDTFEVWYNKLIDVALQNWFDGKTEQEIRSYVDSVMGFTG